MMKVCAQDYGVDGPVWLQIAEAGRDQTFSLPPHYPALFQHHISIIEETRPLMLPHGWF